MAEKALRKSYSPNYFSVDYILACQTPVPCQTKINLPKFGFLVPDCQSQDLPAGVNFDLPLWAARIVCKPGRVHASVNIPPGFKESYSIEMVNIDGTRMTTDLRKVNRHYYEVGHLCTGLFHEDVGDLAEMIPEVMQQRLLQIGIHVIPGTIPSWTSEYQGEPVPPELMDELEVQISESALQRTNHILEWLSPVLGPHPPTSTSPAPVCKTLFDNHQPNSVDNNNINPMVQQDLNL